MSQRAMEWAIATQGHKNASQKGVLVQLGWRFDEKWGYAWVSHKKLAPACGLSERQLIRHLNKLEEEGYIEVTRGSHHTATKYRLRVDLPPPQDPTTVVRQSRTKNPKRRKISVYQKPLESGTQDFLRGDIYDTSDRTSGVTSRVNSGVTPRVNSGVTPRVNSGVTPRVNRGDIQGNELCSNDARQKEVKKGYVNPVPGIQELKRDEKENIDKKLLLLLPGPDVCHQPGENGSSGRHSQSSVFPGFTKKPITKTVEPENIAAPPDPYAEYQRNIGPLKPLLEDKIRDAAARYGAASIVEAIGIAVAQNRLSWAYTEGILRKWAAEGKPVGPRVPDSYMAEYMSRFGPGYEDPPLEESQEQPSAVSIENGPEAALLWDQALEALKANLDKSMFSTWLANTQAIGFDDVRFVIEVPTPFAIAWLERRLYQTIQNTVGNLAGKVFDIQFQVRERQETSE